MASGRLEAFGASGGADGKEPAKVPAIKKTAPVDAGRTGETRREARIGSRLNRRTSRNGSRDRALGSGTNLAEELLGSAVLAGRILGSSDRRRRPSKAVLDSFLSLLRLLM